MFANKAYFSRDYPMDSKSKADDALRLFCQKFEVPKKFTFDGSKEQGQHGNEFMRQIRMHNINFHVSESKLRRSSSLNCTYIFFSLLPIHVFLELTSKFVRRL